MSARSISRATPTILAGTNVVRVKSATPSGSSSIEGGSSTCTRFTEPLYFLNLLNILYPPKNGSALSAVMGASAKRAHRLQERRSLHRKDSVLRRGRRRRHIRQKSPSVALLDRVARVYHEHRRRRFRPLNVRQCVSRISKTGIRMRALDVHLQVRRIPPLRHHGNRLLVADLSRGNRSRNPRTFRIHSVDHLRPERFGFGIGIRRPSFPFLELAIHNIAGSAWSAVCPDLHPHSARHLPRHFLVGLQHVGRPRYWIADHYERVRLTGSRQRTNCRKRHLFANPALAVPVQICLRLPHDVIAVRQDLRRLRNRNGAERRSLHHFSAMQPAKAEQFNVIRKERVALDPHTSLDHHRAWTFLCSGHSTFLDHYLPLRWSSLCFLRSCRSRAHKKSSRQCRVHPSQFSLHFSFSSSLPNCCEIFSVAISAIPAFTRPSKILPKFLRTFSLSRTAVFTLSQNAVVPICISPEFDVRRSRQYLLQQPHCLRQSIIADQQINLDPFVGSLFVDGQAERAQRTTLQTHAENRSVIGIRDDGSRQEREAAQFIFSYKCLGSGSPCRAPLLYRASTLHRRNRVGHRIRGVSRGIRYARRRFQFVRHFVRTALAPVYPAHRADQHGRSGQRPCSNYCRAPHFQCHMPRAELLAQTHLHARGRLRHGGIFRERAQLNSGRLPGVL